MSQTPIPQLPYDIIDNIITKMKMMEAKEMVADLDNHIHFRTVNLGYGYKIPPKHITKTPFTKQPNIRVDDAKQLYARRFSNNYEGFERKWFLFYKYENTYIYYLRKLNFKMGCAGTMYSTGCLKKEIKKFTDYQKQLKALGMKPMSKMNKSELIRAIMKLE